jgi:hypothetical protein
LPLLTKAQKETWCTALESGKFKQGKEKMYNQIDNSYCCLGVAREVLGTSGNSITLDRNELFGDISRTGNFTLLGMSNLKYTSSLSASNDSGIPFSEIAKHIREFMPTLD